MMQALSAMGVVSEGAFWTFIAVFLRVGAALVMLPALGSMMIPVRIRLVTGFALTLIVSFALAPGTVEASAPNPATIMSEILCGMFLGVLIRLLAMALQVAGSMAAQATSLAQILGNSAADPQPALGYVLSLGGLAFAVVMGLHLKVIAYLVTSYDLVAYGAVLDGSVLAKLGTERAAQTFTLGFTLAAPFVMAAMLYNVTLGVINRAMPQLMVVFVGAPAITAGGLGLLALTAPAIISHWHDILAQTGLGVAP